MLIAGQRPEAHLLRGGLDHAAPVHLAQLIHGGCRGLVGAPSARAGPDGRLRRCWAWGAAVQLLVAVAPVHTLCTAMPGGAEAGGRAAKHGDEWQQTQAAGGGSRWQRCCSGAAQRGAWWRMPGAQASLGAGPRRSAERRARCSPAADPLCQRAAWEEELLLLTIDPPAALQWPPIQPGGATAQHACCCGQRTISSLRPTSASAAAWKHWLVGDRAHGRCASLLRAVPCSPLPC